MRFPCHIRVTPIVLPPYVPIIVPAQQEDMEALLALDGSKVYATTVPEVRADKLRRWYWHIVGHVADSKGVLKDAIHIELKHATQFISNYWLDNDGMVHPLFRSISRGIPYADLRGYVDAAMLVIDTRYPGARPDAERIYGPSPR